MGEIANDPAEQIAEGRPSKPFTPTQMNENTTTSDPSTAAALPTAPGSAAGSFGSEGWADTIDKAASMVYQYANLRAMNAGRVQDRLVREMADLMMLRADLLTIRDTLRAQPNAKLSHPAPNLQQPKPMSENLPTSPTPREPGCAPSTCSACLGASFLTHHAPHMDEPWIAIHVHSARALLSGYDDADFSSACSLMGGYCRLLDDAGLVGEGQTEEEAIRNAQPNTPAEGRGSDATATAENGGKP